MPQPLEHIRGRTSKPSPAALTRARVLPDPDLPNVEKAIFEAVKKFNLHRESVDRDGPEISDDIPDLLVHALLEDLKVCRVRLAMETVWASKNVEAQNNLYTGSRKRPITSVAGIPQGKFKRPRTTPSNTSTISALVTNHGLQCDKVLAGNQATALRGVSSQVMKPSLRTSRKRTRPSVPGAEAGSRQKETTVTTPQGIVGGCRMASTPGGEPAKDTRHDNETARPSKTREEFVEGEHRIVRSESVSVQTGARPGTETNGVSKRRASASLPWWRSVESRMSLPMRHVKEADVLRGYIITLIRSCVRQSWTAEKLRESYDQDPSSVQGRAFLAVGSSLLMLERARHMGQCRMKWHADLVQELLQRRDIEWSPIENDPSFYQFVGCEVCLAHRPATKCLKLKGPKYDSRDFWPTNSVVNILSTTEENGLLSLAVELAPGCRPGQHTGVDDDEVEFWVDEKCLRKCLVFHELVHATSILTEDIMYMVEDELRDGIVDIPGGQDFHSAKSSALEALESHLVDVLSRNESFMSRRIQHFLDILRLGEVYFSAGDRQQHGFEEMERMKTFAETGKIYDAPIALHDEGYGERVRKLESLTERKMSGHPFSAFC